MLYTVIGEIFSVLSFEEERVTALIVVVNVATHYNHWPELVYIPRVSICIKLTFDATWKRNKQNTMPTVEKN